MDCMNLGLSVVLLFFHLLPLSLYFSSLTLCFSVFLYFFSFVFIGPQKQNGVGYNP